jgi:hypothetical protein
MLGACHDPGSPSLTAFLSRGGHLVSVHEDSVAVAWDSVVVRLWGPGMDTTAWTVSQSGSAWLALETERDTGTGVVRWSRYVTIMPQGEFVDTVTVTFGTSALAPLVLVDTFEVRGVPSQFLAARRPWQPGERDALIARITQNREFVFPYAGDISDLAPQIFADTDSVTVVVPNPAFGTGAVALAPGVSLAPRFDATWNIFGIDIRIVNNADSPPDTLDWVGVLWSNPAEPTWKGFVIGASASNTIVPSLAVNTPAFDASGAKSGAGGGEARQSDGTYWQANGAASENTIQVATASYGSPSTIASGPFTGGTVAVGAMNGRLRNIPMTRLFGSTPPATMTVDFDFRAFAISALQIICIFPSPCTSQFPAPPLRRASDPRSWVSERR